MYKVCVPVVCPVVSGWQCESWWVWHVAPLNRVSSLLYTRGTATPQHIARTLTVRPSPQSALTALPISYYPRAIRFLISENCQRKLRLSDHTNTLHTSSDLLRENREILHQIPCLLQHFLNDKCSAPFSDQILLLLGYFSNLSLTCDMESIYFILAS